MGALLGVGVHDVEGGMVCKVTRAVSRRGVELGRVARSQPAGCLVESKAIDRVRGSDVGDVGEPVGVVGGDVVGV